MTNARPPMPRIESARPMTLTIIRIDRPWEPIDRAIHLDLDLAAGLELMTLDVRLVNLGAAPGRYAHVQFQVETDDARIFPAQPPWRRPGLGAAELQSRESARGWLTFAVPVGAAIAVLRWFPRGQPTYPFHLLGRR